MRVLWITNIKVEKFSNSNQNFRGGWMVGALDFLTGTSNCKIAIAYPDKTEKELNLSGIQYFSVCYDLSTTKYNPQLKEQFVKIFRKFQPDIIHIWGTEYIHSYAAVEAAIKCNLINNVIVNIQGLVSVYSQHYALGVEEKYKRSRTLIDLWKHNSISKQIRAFQKRGTYERQVIKHVRHVVGRTTWDKACVKQINPEVCYHFCSEILRTPFYTEEHWEPNQCEKYSIFISQANYPIKGFHFVIDALDLVKKRFPNVKVYIAGSDFFHHTCKYFSVNSKMMMNTYEKYLYEKICEKDLQGNIIFLGELSADQMKRQYLKSNVVVSGSTIENSSNSIVEAMILGVPVVSSFVGGIMDLIDHNENGFLYPCDAPYMLAYYITQIFEEIETAKRISCNARNKMLKNNARETVGQDILKIYGSVVRETEIEAKRMELE